MPLLIKTAISIVILGLLFIISGLLLIQYSPQSLLSLSQYVSPYHVIAEKIDVDLRTPSIDISGLHINTDNESAITLERFSFSTSWQSLNGNKQEWVGFTKNGVVHLNALAKNNVTSSPETSAPNIDALHNMLQRANITVENILIHVTNTSSAKLDYLRRPEVLQAEEQALEFSLHYQLDAISLGLQGTLLSTVNNNAPEIILTLPTVDFRELMSAQSKDKNQQSASTKTTNNPITKNESFIDWSPLSQLSPLNFTFQSDVIQLAQGDISNIRSRITLSNKEGRQRIQQEHIANIALQLNKDIAIDQPVTLRADWKTLGEKTNGADIEGSTTLSVGENTLHVAGKVNINGITEQDISIRSTINQFSTTALSKKSAQQKKTLEGLLPVNASTQLSLQKGQLTLKNILMDTKDSDLSGNFSAAFDKNLHDVRTIIFDINSKKLVIPPLGTITKKSNASTEPANNIPLNWLSKIAVNGNINIGEVILNNQTLLSSARTQLIVEKNKLSLNDLALTANGSDVNGKIAVDLNEKPTHLYAVAFDLYSDQLVISDTEVRNRKVSSPRLTPKNSTLFTDDRLPTDWLNTVKAEGNINIANVIHNNETLVTNANNSITLDKNILTLNTQIGGVAGGKSTINLSIHHKDNTPVVSINASARNLTLGKLGLLPKEELSGGKTNVDISLNSHGISTKALASHLQGNLLLTAKDGVIANNTFEAIGSDVVVKLLNAINPFYKSTQTTNLECAVIKSTIVDGKMLFDDSIAIKTSQMIIIADGEVDLATEQINVGINPKARKGVGVDIASLAKFVAIQGSLTQPKVGVSGKGTAKSLLSIGAAISTGGLSLLATKLADTVISGDACEVAKNAFTTKASDAPASATLIN